MPSTKVSITRSPGFGYLLQESQITEQDSRMFEGLEGVLLRSRLGKDGVSRKDWHAELQEKPS